MVSLASFLYELKSQQSEETLEHARPSPPLPFPAGSELLSLGHYVVNLSHKEADQHLALDCRSQQVLHSKVYPGTTFASLAPLVYSDIEGVHRVLDVVQLHNQVYVFSSKPFGDLHNYLKQRRKLKEGLAASIFRQIVLLVRDAHRKNVVLRDLKLKKFVFEDHEKWVSLSLSLSLSSDPLPPYSGC